jgi:uroporphyrinogen-III synthase
MRILVTRPAAEAERLAQRLRDLGHEPILSPAMDIHFENGPELPFGGVQVILVTSANAVRALARRTEQREIPVFAVGPQTAEVARAAGFAIVQNANGDSNALARKVADRVSPCAGKLLYVTGDISSGFIRNELSQAGFHIEVLQLYRMSERVALSEAAMAALDSGTVDAVMLFSPRSARAFVQQVVRAGLQNQCEKLGALCISPAVAEALDPLCFAKVRVAAHPNRDSMLDILG